MIQIGSFFSKRDKANRFVLANIYIFIFVFSFFLGR